MELLGRVLGSFTYQRMDHLLENIGVAIILFESSAQSDDCNAEGVMISEIRVQV